MEFKARDYRAEEEVYSLTRVSVSLHPLSSSPSPSFSHKQDNESIEFFDPLRGLSTETLEPVEEMTVSERRPAIEATSHLSTKEWTSFNKLLMQRFPVPKMISVSAMTSKTIKGKKVIGEAPNMSDELNDSPKLTEGGFKIVSQQEYTKRLHELKDEIMRSWLSDDRVTALKLSIKVARLLMDTSVAQFYPTLFVLATDIMDMLGDMVWKRIKEKAEFADDGIKICTLSDNFEANNICLEAKETCNNWFRKIASIHELLPRIYLELAIFPCWRFLHDDVTDNLMRLVMMIRGIADPLASAYCRLFLLHCAQKLPECDTGHLITCINDQKTVLKRIVSSKETQYGNFLGDHKLLISLMEPTIEYTMRCIFKDPNQVVDMIVRLGLGKSSLELYGKVPWISIILHYLLKELPTEVVCSNAVEILRLVDRSCDFSFDQCLNYKMLGLKLCEGISQVNTVDAVIDEVIQVATKRKSLDEYLKILDAYMDIILQYNEDQYLSSILIEMFERLCNEVVTEDELASLQSIVVKLVTHFNDMKYVFDLNYFVDIFDVMHGSSRSIVSMHILTNATRNDRIDDPTMIKLLFDVAQSLHDGIDFSSTRQDDNQQAERLIARFVDKVDHGTELDRHLIFLVECRGAFSSMYDITEILVHSSNLLATRALREQKDNINFIKSCITFNEITIPCIPSYSRQLNLYLETAEVSLFGGLTSHSDGLLDSAVCCLQEVYLVDGLRKSNEDADCIVSLVRKLCGFMLLVPGNLEQGVLYIPKSILSLLDSQSWITPKQRIRILCSLLSLSATFAQNELPYHTIHEEVIGNDRLFFGHEMYFQELRSLSSVILCKMVDTIPQEPSQATRGKLALEACNCITSFFVDLYRELVILDKLEQDEQQKHQGGANSILTSKGHEQYLKQELKSQRKQVKLLKKKSLWSRSMEDVMERLVDTVIYLNRQIKNAFESAYDNAASGGCPNMQHKLGPAGLALHYANIVLQIDSIVSRSSPMTSIARSTLYHSLPPDIELAFRSRLASFRVGKERLDVQDIKAEMEKTLCWFSPVAINTAKAHHGFGWVGEWADTGPGGGRKPNGLNDINRIETFNHADKGRTEAYIVELLLWLNLLINQLKISADAPEVQSNTESPKNTNQQPSENASTDLLVADSDSLKHASESPSETASTDLPVVD